MKYIHLFLLFLFMATAYCGETDGPDETVIKGQHAIALSQSVDFLHKDAKDGKFSAIANFILKHIDRYTVSLRKEDDLLIIWFSPNANLANSAEAEGARFVFKNEPFEMLKMSYGR
jgi:broad specificity polyphosphatase/5'/3'-nucleotidase SurE